MRRRYEGWLQLKPRQSRTDDGMQVSAGNLMLRGSVLHFANCGELMFNFCLIQYSDL